MTEHLTCSVVIYSKRDREIRLCHHRAARTIEIDGETVLAVCSRHRGKLRSLLRIKEEAS